MRLGWKVYDKNLLDEVAERNQELRVMLNLVDETAGIGLTMCWAIGWIRRSFRRRSLLAQAGRVIRAVARAGNAVLRGPWGAVPLAQVETLAVRIVAAEAFASASSSGKKFAAIASNCKAVVDGSRYGPVLPDSKVL